MLTRKVTARILKQTRHFGVLWDDTANKAQRTCVVLLRGTGLPGLWIGKKSGTGPLQRYPGPDIELHGHGLLLSSSTPSSNAPKDSPSDLSAFFFTEKNKTK